MSTDVTPSEQPTLTAYVNEEILALMARRRINKAGLARRLGRSEVWVGRRLNGQLSLDLNDLARIAAVLGVSASDLMPRQAGDTRRYPHTSDPLAPRLIATMGQPHGRRPHPRKYAAMAEEGSRGTRAVRLPRPRLISRRRPVTPAVG